METADGGNTAVSLRHYHKNGDGTNVVTIGMGRTIYGNYRENLAL